VDLGYDINPVYKTKKATKSAKAKQVLTGYAIASKGVALAILNPATQQIGLLKGTLSGKSFNFNDSNFNVSQVGSNGVNTRFIVSQPADGIVLAMKYLISNPDSGSKQAILAGLQQAIYVPYSPELNTYELAQAGGQYLDGVMNEVTQELSGIEKAVFCL
jgi:hypothetical protein